MAKKQGYKSSIVWLDRETYNAARSIHAGTDRTFNFQDTLTMLIKEAIAARKEKIPA